MSGTIFFVCWMSWTSRCFPAAMLFQTESRVSCPRRSLNVLRKRGRQWRNRDHWIWCRGTSWVRRQILRKILSDPNSLVNQQLDQSSVSSRDRNLTRNINQNATMYAQERQQDDTQSSSTRKLGREMNLQAQPEPGNWSEVRTAKSEGQSYTYTRCRSPIIGILRKSWRTCGKVEYRRRRSSNCYRSVEDQRIDLETIYVDDDDSGHSSWTKLHWKFGSIQQHKLRGTSESIRFHSEVDIESSSRVSGCDNDWLDISFMDEIYTFSRSSDHVDESKSTRLLRFFLRLGENVRSFRGELKMGKFKWLNFNSPNLPENY